MVSERIGKEKEREGEEKEKERERKKAHLFQRKQNACEFARSIVSDDSEIESGRRRGRVERERRRGRRRRRERRTAVANGIIDVFPFSFIVPLSLAAHLNVAHKCEIRESQ